MADFNDRSTFSWIVFYISELTIYACEPHVQVMIEVLDQCATFKEIVSKWSNVQKSSYAMCLLKLILSDYSGHLIIAPGLPSILRTCR